MKTLLSILLFFTCFSAFSQNPISTPRIRMPDRSGVDTTTIANTGQIVFDADDDKFRFNDGVSWFSFIKEGDATDGWPLSGTGSISGSSTISFSDFAQGTIYVAPDTFAIDLNSSLGAHAGPRISFASHGLSESAGHVSIGTASQLGVDSVRLSFESYFDSTRAVFYDWREHNKRGIEYYQYDSTDWTNSTLVTKGYVDGKVDNAISSATGWPLTGTASLTGPTTINGGGTHDLSFGSSGSRLDDLSVYADASVSFNVASGNNLNTATLTSNLYSLIMYDTDGETIDVEITISTGTSDIINIAKDGNLVFSIDENGHIIYVNPPTDCDGLDANTIWSDSGTLKLCP